MLTLQQSPGQVPDKVADTNHESPRQKSPRRLVKMVCVRDFRDLWPQLSPPGSFGESRRNGIWAYTIKQ